MDQARVYFADMTKFLSGESRVANLVHPMTAKGPLADPGASRDFRDIVDLICNPALIDFRPPKSPPTTPGPLYQAWSGVVRASRGELPPQSPELPAGIVRTSVGADATEASRSFADYLSGTGVAGDVVSWVRFQVSNRELQALFWENNSEAELLEAWQSFLGNISSRMVDDVSSRVRSQVPPSHGYASQYLTSAWTPAAFSLAYAFWAYIKGYRLALQLGDFHVYAVHWLRERAAIDGSDKTFVGKDKVDLPVPWGYLVEAIVADWPKGSDVTPLNDALLELRRYTIAQLNSASTPAMRREFLVEGLRGALRVLRHPTGRTAALDLIAGGAAESAEKLDSGAAVASFVIRSLLRAVPQARRRRKARLLISQNEPHLRRFIETGHRYGRAKP